MRHVDGERKVEIQWVRPIVKNKTKKIAGKRESPREERE
jgi:hypothetical protein